MNPELTNDQSRGIADPMTSNPAATTPVSIERCATYEQSAVDHAVAVSIERIGGIQKFIQGNERVLIKVNLLSDRPPEKAVTTHPAMALAVARQVIRAGATPVIADSGFPFVSFKRVARKSGMGALCDAENIELLELDDPVTVENPSGQLVKSFKLTRHLEKFDAIIDVPKLKTHNLMIFSGAVKNLFGFVAGREKPAFHLKMQQREQFAAMLLDLYALLQPKIRLVLMDGIVGMEGPGPMNGTPRDIGLVVGGTNPLAVDTLVTELLGITEQVPYLQAARQWGHSFSRLDHIELVNGNIEDFLIREFRAPVYKKTYRTKLLRMTDGLLPFPAIKNAVCAGCKRCLDACPATAITMSEKIAQIDYGQCIRCYCCDEMCPEGGVYLDDSLFWTLIRRANRWISERNGRGQKF